MQYPLINKQHNRNQHLLLGTLFSVVFLALIFFIATTVFAWTNTGGGDHGGNDWNISSGTIRGTHTNIGTFTVSGTVYVSSGVSITANDILISGQLNGDGRGNGGSNGGSGGTGDWSPKCRVRYCASENGRNGRNGSNGYYGGDSNSNDNVWAGRGGRGGGGGGGGGGANCWWAGGGGGGGGGGGNGGSYVKLIATNTLTIPGSIYIRGRYRSGSAGNGENGVHPSSSCCGCTRSGGGGGGRSGGRGGSAGGDWSARGGNGGNGGSGSGGGVLLKASMVDVSGGIINAYGGAGSSNPGNLKIRYGSSYTAGTYYRGQLYVSTYDATPPVMSANPDSGTYLATLDYTAQWNDSESGLSTCSIKIDNDWYVVNGCNGTTKNYNGSFSNSGTHTIQLYGEDLDGNYAYSSTYNYEIQDATPTVNISASPNPINYIASSTLSWSSANATSCNASGDWSGAKGLSGLESTGNLTSNKTYTISCTGSTGSSNNSVTVNVNPPKQCQDSTDNDNDGWIDYPADPGCLSASDDNESNSGSTQCSDGIDNDSDSLIDGNDPNCTFPSDNSEFDDPDFSISKSSDISATIVRGQQKSSQITITVNPNATFSNDVSLSVDSVTPLIPGASYNFGDTILSSGEYANGSSFWAMVPAGTLGGAYTISIKGVGGSLSKIVNVNLNVNFIAPSFENF